MTTLDLLSHATSTTTINDDDLWLTGSARLTLVINLRHFVHPADLPSFEHLRGGDAYAEALRSLNPQSPFLLDTHTAELEQQGYALRVFRSRLLYNQFFPTYKVSWDETMRSRLEAAGCADIHGWQHWRAHTRLTRNGLAVVMLEHDLDNLPLLSCAEHVLELTPAGTPHANGQDQWWLGHSVLQALLDAIGRCIVVRHHDTTATIRFADEASTSRTLRLDRYMIYSLRRIERGGVLVPPGELKQHYAPLLAAFMEGALIEHDGKRSFPRYTPESARHLLDQNTATWNEELCIFTGESALIYRPMDGQALAYIGGPLGLSSRAYSSYWAAIERGIEHMVAYRSEVQQLERYTNHLLSKVPHLTRKVNDGQINREDSEEITALASGLSDIFDILPEQRGQLVTASIFRADYVRQKFDRLLEELDVPQTLELVNTNVEQISFFLSYYNDMRLQWQGQRSNRLALILTVVLMFMALSSFLADTFQVLEPQASERQIGPFTQNQWMLIAFGILTVTVVVWQGYQLARWRWHKR